MEQNPRKALNQFMKGLEAMNTEQQESTKAFFDLLGTVYAPTGTVPVKIKELISVGIAAYSRCEYCIVYHVYKALEAGANRQEIMEASMVAVAMGGGPSMAYISTLLRSCVDELESDFQR